MGTGNSEKEGDRWSWLVSCWFGIQEEGNMTMSLPKWGRCDLCRSLTPLSLRRGVKTQGKVCLLSMFDNKAGGWMSSSLPVLSNSAPTTPLRAIYHCYPPLKGEERLNSLSKATSLKNIRVGIQTQVSTPASIHYPALLWDAALKFGLGCQILAEVSYSSL